MTDPNFEASVHLILQAAAAGKPHHEVVLSLGPTPPYLLGFGFPDLELKIQASTIDKSHFLHGITRSMINRLGDIIQSPKALYKSATVVGTAVVVTFEQKNGRPILVPIHPNRLIGRDVVNLVTSIYDKEPEVESRWAAKGLLLWKK